MDDQDPQSREDAEGRGQLADADDGEQGDEQADGGPFEGVNGAGGDKPPGQAVGNEDGGTELNGEDDGGGQDGGHVARLPRFVQTTKVWWRMAPRTTPAHRAASTSGVCRQSRRKCGWRSDGRLHHR